jgi:hypothetical protein
MKSHYGKMLLVGDVGLLDCFEKWSFCVPCPRKIGNISGQGVPILDPRPFFEAPLNFTRSFKTREQDLITTYL